MVLDKHSTSITNCEFNMAKRLLAFYFLSNIFAIILSKQVVEDLLGKMDGYVKEITDNLASKIANDFKLWTEKVESDPLLPKDGYWGLQFLMDDHQKQIQQKMDPIKDTVMELVKESLTNATHDNKTLVIQDSNNTLVVYEK